MSDFVPSVEVNATITTYCNCLEGSGSGCFSCPVRNSHPNPTISSPTPNGLDETTLSSPGTENSSDIIFDHDCAFGRRPFMNSADNCSSVMVLEESHYNMDMLLSSPDQSNRSHTFSCGEPSEAPPPSQEQKPKSVNKKQSVKEHMRYKPVKKVIKILGDRCSRKEKMEGSVKDDAVKIKKELADIRKASKRMSKHGKSEEHIKEVLGPRLEKVEQDIEKLARRGSKEDKKASKLAGAFIDADGRTDEETTKRLGKQFREEFPVFTMEDSTNQPTADQCQGSRQTPESAKYTVKDVADLEEKLFGNNGKAVGFSDFQDLEEERIATGWKIPKSLQDFATKFREACGEKIASDAYLPILVFLSAAAREMMEKHEGIHQLKWERLSIWGATYNQAREMGFEQELQFMKVHLKKLLHAYLGFHFGKAGDLIQCFQLQKEGDLKELVPHLDSGLQLVKQCLSAAEFFKEKPLIHGLFPRALEHLDS